MKLELIREIDSDGTWYMVVQDGISRCFKVKDSEEATKQEALKEYQKRLDIAISGIGTREVIKSTEI